MSNNFFTKGPTFKPEVTTGRCPTCHELTMLVSLTRDFYRCITCGADLEQKINLRTQELKYIQEDIR